MDTEFTVFDLASFDSDIKSGRAFDFGDFIDGDFSVEHKLGCRLSNSKLLEEGGKFLEEDSGVHGAAWNLIVDFNNFIEFLDFIGVVKVGEVPLDAFSYLVVGEIVARGRRFASTGA